MEFSVEKILCNVLRFVSLTCAPMIGILNRGFYISGATNTKHSLVTDVNIMVFLQIIANAPVAFVRTFVMNLFCYLGYMLILFLTSGEFAVKPVIVG